MTSTIIMEGGDAFVMVTIPLTNPERAVIHDLMVHESRRGDGLGRELLNAACVEAKTMPASIISLFCEPGSWLEEWYKRHGFKEVAREPILGPEFGEWAVLEKPCEEVEL